ncbi:MAG TPA: branched-chain amino acid ABC transporter permease [Pyrodictium sp.]|nr:branched-chain amino acid ABC transporter permease [Pyrodictium sp.]
MSFPTQRELVTALAVLIFAIAADGVAYVFDKPFLANSIYLALMYALAGLAWNILAGFTGLVSFGHAVFFGLGAYATMIAMLHKIPAVLGILLAGGVGFLAAVLLAPIWLRLKSHWFTLATIATAEILKLSFIVWPAVGGASGLQAPIAEPGEELYYLYFRGAYLYVFIAAVLVAIEVVVLWSILRGPIGYKLQAIREDEDAAMALAIDPLKYKFFALAISGFFTGLAGSLYTIRYRFIDPFTVFDLISVSTYIALVGIVGGIYTFLGPIIGSFIVVPAAEYVRSTLMSIASRYAALHGVVLGAVLLIVSLMAPEGVVERVRAKMVVWSKVVKVVREWVVERS